MRAEPQVARLTYSVGECARILGISRASVFRGVRRGTIPHVRIGGRIVIPRAALDRLLASAERR